MLLETPKFIAHPFRFFVVPKIQFISHGIYDIWLNDWEKRFVTALTYTNSVYIPTLIQCCIDIEFVMEHILQPMYWIDVISICANIDSTLPDFSFCFSDQAYISVAHVPVCKTSVVHPPASFFRHTPFPVIIVKVMIFLTKVRVCFYANAPMFFMAASVYIFFRIIPNACLKICTWIDIILNLVNKFFLGILNLKGSFCNAFVDIPISNN